ncbi:Crp/Fnr family transcriptional regulator [Prevotella corporis]|jgi:CRP-like cAMP-binding protein|uniref:Crp/Fnr family transcriptional regulator n=1 Tax=Prevotella corporis TaxID=28128 RepID=UPI0023F15B6A|nr:Crp/Fnr family transcriptional regulator [Prevotella corporis]
MEDRFIKVLSACPLFVGMSMLQIDMALESASYRVVELPSHDVYALAGMPCRYADIIVKGTLISRMASISGKQVEVTRLKEGTLVAPAFIFATEKALPVSVETDGNVELLRMKPDELKALIDTDEQIRMNFIRILSNIDVFLTHKMKVLSLFTVREKVAYLLLELSKEQQSLEIHLQRSRQEIADSFGIQKFSLLRVLSDFEKEGALEINGKVITIIDRQKLIG